ncbi:MAG: GNAT family N-acetyltransferase [Nostocaceae cyanobacterium]|nr:GNAT family N-acetyltransferase [Nostocaceae cyanobacterium]
MIADTKTIIVEKIGEIESIKSLWNELKNKHQPENIFVDIDFYCGMFEVTQQMGDPERVFSPYVVIFCQGNEPVAGIIARSYQRRPRFRFGYVPITMPAVRCLDLEIGGLMANDSNGINLVRNHLASLVHNRSVDMLSCDYLAHKSDFWQCLVEDAELGVKAVCSSSVEWVTQIADPNSGERIVQQKSGKSERRARAAERKLYKHFCDQIEISCFKRLEEVRDFLIQAEAICTKTYHNGINTGIENNQAWRGEFELLAKAGNFRGYMLYGDGEPISYNVGVAYKGTFMGYAMAFDPRFSNLSPGTFMMRKIMDMLFAEGIHTIHFGYGDADYKRRFGTDCFEGASLHFYTKTPKAILLQLVEMASIKTTNFAKNTLKSLGILAPLKKLWRDRLTSSK